MENRKIRFYTNFTTPYRRCIRSIALSPDETCVYTSAFDDAKRKVPNVRQAARADGDAFASCSNDTYDARVITRSIGLVARSNDVFSQIASGSNAHSRRTKTRKKCIVRGRERRAPLDLVSRALRSVAQSNPGTRSDRRSNSPARVPEEETEGTKSATPVALNNVRRG